MNSILNLLLYFYFSVAYNLHTGKCLYLNSTVRYHWASRICWIWGGYDISRWRSSEDGQKRVLDKRVHTRDWVLGVLWDVVLGMQMKWLIRDEKLWRTTPHSFFWLWLVACGILVPWPGVEPASPAVKIQSTTWRAKSPKDPFFDLNDQTYSWKQSSTHCKSVNYFLSEWQSSYSQ